jgi:hypothetical protein
MPFVITYPRVTRAGLSRIEQSGDFKHFDLVSEVVTCLKKKRGR